MDIMTKVRVLWEKITGLENKEATTAATLANILPRIPKDYSTNETPTGQKWIDGKEIYRKIFIDNLPTFTGGQNYSITFSNWDYEEIIEIIDIVRSSGNETQTNRYPLSINKSNNTITIYSIATGYSEGSVIIIVYYTKPDPVPAQVDKGTGMITGEDPEPETKKRKTKKEEK